MASFDASDDSPGMHIGSGLQAAISGFLKIFLKSFSGFRNSLENSLFAALSLCAEGAYGARHEQ